MNLPAGKHYRMIGDGLLLVLDPRIRGPLVVANNITNLSLQSQ